jgi:membrane-associated phospholipid phosphatase
MASSPIATRLNGMTVTVSSGDPSLTSAGVPVRTPPVSMPRQAAIGVAALTGFLLVRGAVATDGRALDNAGAVEDLERSAGLLREDWLREHALANAFVANALEFTYAYGPWIAAGAVLVWLARRHPALYYRARDAMLLTAAAALFLFVLFPVAPPDGTGLFVVLPSLQAGWAVLLGLGIAAATRRAWGRIAGAALAVGLAASVVLTGHHYVVDAIAGAALTAGAWLFILARRRPAALRGYAGWDGLKLH